MAHPFQLIKGTEIEAAILFADIDE